MRANPYLSYLRILLAQLSLIPLKTHRWEPLHPFLDSLSETKARLRLPWRQWLNPGENCDRYRAGNTGEGRFILEGVALLTLETGA